MNDRTNSQRQVQSLAGCRNSGSNPEGAKRYSKRTVLQTIADAIDKRYLDYYSSLR